MNKRELNLQKYGISSKRYKELCGFCEQYPEWVAELKFRTDTVKGRCMTDMPRSNNGHSDPTGNLAVRRVGLQHKCELVEQAAREASEELYPYIMKSVCYEVNFHYLQTVEELPCSRAAFYDTRRYFFYLLNQKKGM